MPRLNLAPVFAGALILTIPFVASAAGPCLDPVKTHTNGMPLASSDPLRSSNVNYQCDPDRHGCCGGRYNMPCLRSLLLPDNCCLVRRSSCYGQWAEPIGGVEDLEPARFEVLGEVPNDGAPAAGGLVPAGSAPQTQSLLESLQG